MKIIEIATGKEVDTEELGLCIRNNKVYQFKQWCGEFLQSEWSFTNVSDKYSIVSDVRSREEIEERINELENEYLETLDGEAYRQMRILQWVLKESE